MNRTKRRIFETAMDLFAKQGYDATSIEEITAIAGIAKGTLYYHFSSKEEILDNLIKDGMELLQHSLELKIKRAKTYDEKVKAIILVEVKVASRYENLIDLVMKEYCGNASKNEKCRECVKKCIDIIEDVIISAVNEGVFKECDTRAVAFEIFGIICSCVMMRYEMKSTMNFNDVANRLASITLNGIKL